VPTDLCSFVIFLALALGIRKTRQTIAYKESRTPRDFPGAIWPSAVTPASLATCFLPRTPGISVNGFFRSFLRADVRTGMLRSVHLMDVFRLQRRPCLRSVNAPSAGVNVNTYALLVGVPGIGVRRAGYTGVGTPIQSPVAHHIPILISPPLGSLPKHHQPSLASTLPLMTWTPARSIAQRTLTRQFRPMLWPVKLSRIVTDLGISGATMGANVWHYTARRRRNAGWLRTRGPHDGTMHPPSSPATRTKALKVQRGSGNSGYNLWMIPQLAGLYDSTCLIFSNNPMAALSITKPHCPAGAFVL